MTPSSSTPRKVFLADDQIAIRQLVKIFLTQHMPDCEVVGEASSATEALARMQLVQPEVVVADVFFHDLSAVDFLEKCRAMASPSRMVVFCRWGDTGVARKLLAAGANAVVAKDDSLEILQIALSAVLGGGYYLAPSVEAALYRDRDEGAALTDRELLVLRLIAEGCQTKEVGSKLEISVKTAEKYRERIMQKLRVHDVVSLTRYAIRHGIAAL
jgi:DNA-binding NarL/FixJ family response regulator